MPSKKCTPPVDDLEAAIDVANRAAGWIVAQPVEISRFAASGPQAWRATIKVHSPPMEVTSFARTAMEAVRAIPAQIEVSMGDLSQTVRRRVRAAQKERCGDE